MLKRLIIPILILLIVFNILYNVFYLDKITYAYLNIVNDTYKTYFEPKESPKGSLEELYKDVFMTMLDPYIQEAVNNYYEMHTGYSPKVDPCDPKIIYIGRPNGYRKFGFEIMLQVSPYLGAHNSIGTDLITFNVSSMGDVTIQKFEHIKDYPIPPWLEKTD